mgnify:CR=1 FL=1
MRNSKIKPVIVILSIMLLSIPCRLPGLSFDHSLTLCEDDPIPMIDMVKSEDSLYFDCMVRLISEESGARPDWIMATIMIESRFNEDARNETTDAYGLIQFMPKTLEWMGVSEADLENGQLHYVRKYFQEIVKHFGRINSPEDTYLAVFYPKAMGKPLAYRIGGAKVYRLNSGLDANHDGVLTKEDIKRKINALL